MMLSLAFLIAFTQVPTPSPPDYSPIEVRSTDGTCIARIDRAAGQERVAPSMARFCLKVLELAPAGVERELWQTLYPFDGAPAHYLLENRGRVFARVAKRFTESRPVISLHANEREPVEWTGAQLSIPREALGGTDLERTWLDDEQPPAITWADSAFGPRLELRIPCRGGLLRIVALDQMALIDPDAPLPEPRVEPLAWIGPPQRFIVPYVNSVQAAPRVRAGEVVEVQIAGNHPTPGHRFLGFHLILESDARTTQGDAVGKLTLYPRSRPPDGVQAQVLSPVQGVARIFDLAPGRYRVDVEGWERRAPEVIVEVLPVGWIASLHTTGGIMGMNQWIEIFEQGVARVTGRDGAVTLVDVPPDSVQQIAARIEALQPEGGSGFTPGAADLFEYTLTYWRGERSGSQSFDSLAATPALREIVEKLRALVFR